MKKWILLLLLLSCLGLSGCLEGANITINLSDFLFGHAHRLTAVEGQPATCTEAGFSSHQVCVLCQETVDYVNLPATGHSYQEISAKPATCTEAGFDTYRFCPSCQIAEGYTELAPLGHSFETVVAQPASCTTPGFSAHEVCSRCNLPEGKTELLPTGHTLVQVAQLLPTETEDGHSAHLRCACGYTEGYTFLPALSHSHHFELHDGIFCTAQGCKLFHSCPCGVSLLIPLEQRYFYQQLSAQQQENLIAYYNGLMDFQTDWITLPHTVTKAQQRELDYLIVYLCPELFHTDTNSTIYWQSFSTGEETLYRGVKRTYIMDEAAYKAQCDSLADHLADLIVQTAHLTDWEKERYIYDDIIDRTVYEARLDNDHNPHEGSCLGPLVVGRARCQGFTNAMTICLWAVGIECYGVTGTTINATTGQPENHAWNIVKLEGNYYLCDATWDNRDNEETLYRYFNQDTSGFDNHYLDELWTPLNIPECNATGMDYYTVMDCFISQGENAGFEFTRTLSSYYRSGQTLLLLKVETQEHFSHLLERMSDYISQCMWQQGIFTVPSISYMKESQILIIRLAY